MVRAIIFAVLFIVVGGILFALIAPLVFQGANMEKVGQAAFPIIAPVCGVIGFIVGLKTRKKG